MSHAVLGGQNWFVAAASLIRRRVVRDYLQGAVWVLPGLGIVLGLGAGALLSGIQVRPGSLLERLAFQGSANDAQLILTTVSATMITLTGIVFALTVVALQIASSQFSVRLLRTFLRDVANQVVLAIFVCTFAYSAGGLYTVGQRSGGGSYVPQVAVSGALGLALASTGALVFFLHHLMHSIQIDTIVESTQLRTLAVVDELFPDADSPGPAPPQRPAPPQQAAPLLAPQSGYLQAVDVEDLANLAGRSGHTVVLVVAVGDYVTAGDLVGWCWLRGAGQVARPPDSDWLRRFLDHVHIGFERTLHQDIRFGLRQMVDVALRALSPAVNDPYTGVQVVHHLSAVESILASRALGDDVRRDGSGAVLVWLPYPGFATYLQLGCGQIRRYGAHDPLVLMALLQMLSSAAARCVDPSRRADVQAQIDHVVRVAERELSEPSDRAMVAAAGVGATAVVSQPGTLAPPPSTFGQVAAAAAIRGAADPDSAARRGASQ
jgi:uncharacterized membrane protein